MKITADKIEVVEVEDNSTDASIPGFSLQTHGFSLQIGNSRFNFVEGDNGMLKVYSEETIIIEPRASNSFYLWSVKRNWEIGK